MGTTAHLWMLNLRWQWIHVFDVDVQRTPAFASFPPLKMLRVDAACYARQRGLPDLVGAVRGGVCVLSCFNVALPATKLECSHVKTLHEVNINIHHSPVADVFGLSFVTRLLSGTAVCWSGALMTPGVRAHRALRRRTVGAFVVEEFAYVMRGETTTTT
jgi:hypothetical protein